MWHVSAFVVWLIVCCSLAGLVGGAAERIAALLLVSATVATAVVDGFRSGATYEFMRPGLFVIDTILLILLYRLALTSTRFWPIWITAFQMLTVIAHLLRLLDVQMLPKGYYGLVNLSAWPIVGLTAIGTLRHLSRRRRFGSDPSFKRSSPL